ncbi:MAG: hypothetical protein KTR30_13725 [Saprospiraceae bacterium]|nr:hypothetical protein [Saprospiraceae bacterium]
MSVAPIFLKFWMLFCCLLPLSSVLGQQEAVFRTLDMKAGLSQGTVFAITQDDVGHMWFGTRDGLNKYDGYQFTVYRNIPEQSSSLLGNDIYTNLIPHFPQNS